MPEKVYEGSLEDRAERAIWQSRALIAERRQIIADMMSVYGGRLMIAKKANAGLLKTETELSVGGEAARAFLTTVGGVRWPFGINFSARTTWLLVDSFLCGSDVAPKC